MNAPLKAVHFEDAIAPHVRAILGALGEDVQREGLAQGVRRLRRASRPRLGGGENLEHLRFPAAGQRGRLLRKRQGPLRITQPAPQPLEIPTREEFAANAD